MCRLYYAYCTVLPLHGARRTTDASGASGTMVLEGQLVHLGPLVLVGQLVHLSGTMVLVGQLVHQGPLVLVGQLVHLGLLVLVGQLSGTTGASGTTAVA